MSSKDNNETDEYLSVIQKAENVLDHLEQLKKETNNYAEATSTLKGSYRNILSLSDGLKDAGRQLIVATKTLNKLNSDKFPVLIENIKKSNSQTLENIKKSNSQTLTEIRIYVGLGLIGYIVLLIILITLTLVK